MVILFFFLGLCYATEDKGPRPDPTIDTQLYEYEEIPMDIIENIISALEKSEKSNRIIYIDNNDHFDSSLLTDIQTSRSACPVHHIYIIISLLSAIIVLHFLTTFFEFISMKRNPKKLYEKGERMIVSENL
jgi:hypothetical protein